MLGLELVGLVWDVGFFWGLKVPRSCGVVSVSDS